MPTLTKLFTLKEAAEHNTKEDCWCVIDGKVYDVTSYLDDHPGGDEVILEVTGKDATDEFEDAGHSKDARDMLKDYFIGELDESSLPELEIFIKNQPSKKNFTDLAKQYWALPVAVAAISIVAGIIYLRRK